MLPKGAAKHLAIAYPLFENFWICPLFHLGNPQKNRYNLKMNVSQSKKSILQTSDRFYIEQSLLF